MASTPPDAEWLYLDADLRVAYASPGMVLAIGRSPVGDRCTAIPGGDVTVVTKGGTVEGYLVRTPTQAPRMASKIVGPPAPLLGQPGPQAVAGPWARARLGVPAGFPES